MLPPYKWKYPSQRKEELPRGVDLSPENETEALTGWVNGLKASDLEERLARAFRSKNLDFIFQYNLFIQGRKYKNTIDFLVNVGLSRFAIEVYGEYTHESQADREADAQREAELNITLQKDGIENIIVVWHWEIPDAESAEIKVDELFL